MKFIKPVTLTDAMLVSSSAPETDHAAWNAATAYNIGDRVIRTATHRIYERVVAGTTATAPELDAVNWLDVAPTNRWAMFDRVVGTETALASGPLAVEIDPGIVNALALLDLLANTVRVEITDGVTSYYDRMFVMEDYRATFGWYGYFFEPLSPQTDLIVEDLPPLGLPITITIAVSTGGVACGTLAVGSMVALGDTLRNVGVGIIDYSRKTTDDFGVTAVVERPYAKRVDVPMLIRNGNLDYVVRNLAEVRATACVWVTSARFSALILFGFYKDWTIDIAYPDHAEGRLTIEALT